MWEKGVVYVVLVLVSISSVLAQDPFEVPCTESVIGSTKTVAAGETWNADCGANRFHIGQCMVGGGDLTVDGGTVTVNCLDRFVIENGGQLTMNDGEMTVTVIMAEDKSVMLSDNCESSQINLNGGTLTIDASIKGECERSPRIVVGCGQLRCAQDWMSLWECGEIPIESAPGHEPWQYYQEGSEWVLTGSSCGGGPQGCTCLGEVTDDGQVDLDDLQAVAAVLLEAGSPFVVQVEPGDCADLNADGQLDLDDLQALASILLDAGSPFISSCD